MAWVEPRRWVVGETVTAAMLNEQVRDNFLASLTQVATVDTGETTTSTTYTNLATAGPTLTITAGGPEEHILFGWTAQIVTAATSLQSCRATVATSGITVDATIELTITAGAAVSSLIRASRFHELGVTGASVEYKMMYRVSTGTGTFSRRTLLAIPANLDTTEE